MRVLVHCVAIICLVCASLGIVMVKPAAAIGACNANGMKVATGRAQPTLNLDPDTVQISEAKCGMMSASWTAKLPNGDTYKCKSDDMLRNPYCFKVEKPK